jgi:hypothetical protein
MTVFCWNLGIRLIYTADRHPQIYGKLEQAFRDDIKDSYPHLSIVEVGPKGGNGR